MVTINYYLFRMESRIHSFYIINTARIQNGKGEIVVLYYGHFIRTIIKFEPVQ